MRKNINQPEYEEDNTREILPEFWRHIDQEGRCLEQDRKEYDRESERACDDIWVPFSLFTYGSCEDDGENWEDTWCEDRENSALARN